VSLETVGVWVDTAEALGLWVTLLSNRAECWLRAGETEAAIGEGETGQQQQGQGQGAPPGSAAPAEGGGVAAPNSGARAAAVNVGMKYAALTACGVSCAFRPRPREVSLPPRPRCSLYPGGG
jgi:hypothetical protein